MGGRAPITNTNKPQATLLIITLKRALNSTYFLSRVSMRGTLNDARNKTIRTQDEALDSKLWSCAYAAFDVHNLEDGNSVERIDQGSSASCRRIRKRAHTNREASSARTPPAA